MRDGEGDRPALGRVHQALLDQRVAGGGERGGLAAEGDGHLRRGDRGAARAAEIGHRVHVLALGGGGAVVAGAEEPDGELGLGDRGGHRDVVGGDGGGGREVPGDLAVGLDEVRVPVGGGVQGVQRGRLERDVLPRGRGQQRVVGRLAVEPVDPQVAEQPLGVALGRAQHRGQVGEPGADDDQRRALLGELVAGGADRRDVVGLHVLHLVDEQRDAAADVGGHAGGVAEQLDEVDLHVAGVGPAGRGGDVDARLPAVADLRVARRLPQGEGLEDAEDLLDRLLVLVARPELAQRHVQRRGDRAAAATAPGAPRSCRCPSRGRSRRSGAG